jgi:hypothetical protein
VVCGPMPGGMQETSIFIRENAKKKKKNNNNNNKMSLH